MRVAVSLCTVWHQPFRQRRFQFDYDRFKSFAVGKVIPRRSPVLNRPVCYREDCRQYQRGRSVGAGISPSGFASTNTPPSKSTMAFG